MDIYATAMYVEYVRDKRACTWRTRTWHMYVINARARTHNGGGGAVGGQGVALPTENAATNQKVTEKQILISPC